MKYICGIDIGSSKIAASLGAFRGSQLVNLWWDSLPAVGIKQGYLKDIQGLTGVLSELLKKIRTKSGIKIKSVYLGIAGPNIASKHSKAAIALAERGNKSVTEADIQRVSQQAQILGSCLEEEILHATPLSYRIDNEDEVVNPLGLYGHQLRVDMYLICAKTAYINTITEIVNRLGLKLNGITLSGLAASLAVFNPDKTKGLNVLCDIGKDVTQILIFDASELRHYQVLGVGGEDLTLRLSRELNIPHFLAEEVKISYGRIQYNYNYQDPGHNSNAGLKDTTESEAPDKEIIIKKGKDYTTLSQNLIIQILSRASRCIAEAIRDVVKPHILAIASPIFPERVTLYVSGRTACLDGFLESLEVVIGLPVKLARITNSTLLVPLMRQRLLSGASVLNYLASFGLIADAIKLYHSTPLPQWRFRNFLSYIPYKLKEIYQEYF